MDMHAGNAWCTSPGKCNDLSQTFIGDTLTVHSAHSSNQQFLLHVHPRAVVCCPGPLSAAQGHCLLSRHSPGSIATALDAAQSCCARQESPFKAAATERVCSGVTSAVPSTLSTDLGGGGPASESCPV